MISMKNKNNKGFTLIELMAVVIVLIVIIFIAINKVGKSTKETKLNSIKANAITFIKAVDEMLDINYLNDVEELQGSISIATLLDSGVNVSGTKPDSGVVLISDSSIIAACLGYERYSVYYVEGSYTKPEKSPCDSSIGFYEYAFTESEKVLKIPFDGLYKVEVWGAQGGNSLNNSLAIGGYGGYSVGTLSLNKDDKLYINVGGKGTDGNNSSTTKPGGYNGGGAKTNPDAAYYGSSGGGASHIASSSGLLSSLSSKLNSVLIVAGGGGGGAGVSGNYGYGGSGGGYNGVRGYNFNNSTGWGAGATQTAGGCQNTSSNLCGTFGQANSTSGGHGGAGGGGLYGGGSSNGGNIGGGGGGSGYIGNPLLTDKVMYCYNCTASNDASTKTVTTTCAEETPTENCAKIGDGYIKVSYIGKPANSDEETNIALDFDYTGSEKTYQVKKAGKYKIEAWGAQGGSVQSLIPGYGGYSSGYVNLKVGDKIYINVGGAGGVSTTKAVNQHGAGGYNGGGTGLNSTSTAASWTGGGGGATHIALESGLLYTFETKQNKLLIVAGGGGGTWYYSNSYKTVTPGHGGGFEGNSCYNSTSNVAAGGTQTSGYAFGKAWDVETWEQPGAGGGYYSGQNHSYCGAGGSGYIGNTLLSNKVMYCYNCKESADSSTKTVSTTCASETPTENCAKKGNGYVKISFVP